MEALILCVALLSGVTVTERNGNVVTVRRGTPTAWTISGSTMTLTYIPDKIFANGFD